MRKKKIYLLFIPILLFSDFNIKTVSSVLSSIRLENKYPSYYTQNKSFLTQLNVPKSKSIESADILLFPKDANIKKTSIVNSYRNLKRNRESIGAIYMKKGRMQIMFIEERLKAKGLKLSNKYRRYLLKERYLNSPELKQ